MSKKYLVIEFTENGTNALAQPLIYDDAIDKRALVELLDESFSIMRRNTWVH